jgi:hypothetical protein
LRRRDTEKHDRNAENEFHGALLHYCRKAALSPCCQTTLDPKKKKMKSWKAIVENHGGLGVGLTFA